MDMSGVRPTFTLHRDAAGVRRQERAAGPSCGPVSSVRVDPRVWSVAMDLCGGDPLRLEVVSSTEVVVHNQTRG